MTWRQAWAYNQGVFVAAVFALGFTWHAGLSAIIGTCLTFIMVAFLNVCIVYFGFPYLNTAYVKYKRQNKDD